MTTQTEDNQQHLILENKKYKVANLNDQQLQAVKALNIGEQVVSQKYAEAEVARIGKETLYEQLKLTLEGMEYEAIEAPTEE